MRHLYLILLFSYTAFFSQAKITAYRLLIEDDDGPCCVKYYIEDDNTDYFFNYVTAQSTDTVMVNRLLAINSKAKKKDEVDFWCEAGTYGGDMIHNMIVVEKDNIRDTIYLTRQNTYIVFPDEHKAYPDSKLILKKSLTGIIKEFFEFDFTRDIRGMRMIDFPTQDSGIVLFKGKNLEGYTKYEFEKQFGKLTLVDKVNNYGRKEFVYSLNGNIYTFEDDVRLISVEVNNPDSGWEIDGLSIGSKQELFSEKYPESMSFNAICSERYEDYKKEQLHWLLFNEHKGSVSYWIKEGMLNRFTVFYN